ncbi:DUF7344 domain-containing protein [Haloarchaeobius sp. TZWWS8]|uniref:DUF7344 domain-containing protein n=1 Tax=Haloarchaeobius sp. TZWWS8 TaxID=3446121 RepID=UPI003EBFBC44
MPRPPVEEDALVPVFSKDTVFQTLSNQRRRLVLQALADHDQLTVRQLTAYVAAAECGVAAEALDYKQRKRVYTSLVQTHLPTMDKSGIIHYDKSRGTVAATDNLSEFEIYLEVVPKEELLWSEFYLGLAIVFGLLTGLAWLDVAPFGMLPDLTYAGLFVWTLATVAIVHLRSAGEKRFGSQSRPRIVERIDGDTNDGVANDESTR